MSKTKKNAKHLTKTKDKNEPINTEKRSYTAMITSILIVVLIISIISYSLYLTGNPSPKKTLVLATTTSVSNTGLLDEIIPDFEEQYGMTVKIIPVGTGQAFEMGRRGDVDILLVHAPSQEKTFISQGYGIERYLICYNYFIIVGPPSDQAHLKNTTNATAAMQAIYTTQSRFISRGDSSGTHIKEQELWAAAGFNYSAQIDIPENDWYYSVSAGMGDTLIRANELNGYTLSDEGTFWAYSGNLSLQILLKNDSSLLNQYSVIPINPATNTNVNYNLSMRFVEWITSPETQSKIAGFEKNGHQLFVPNANTSP